MKRVYYEVRGHEASGWPLARDFARLREALKYGYATPGARPEITKVTREDVPPRKGKKR